VFAKTAVAKKLKRASSVGKIIFASIPNVPRRFELIRFGLLDCISSSVIFCGKPASRRAFQRPAFFLSLTPLSTLLKQGLLFILMTDHQLDFSLGATFSKAVMWVNLKLIIARPLISIAVCAVKSDVASHPATNRKQPVTVGET
jgi:hypothetical protein